MSQPEIKLGLVANLFSRMMYFKKKGDIELGHTHPFDHLTLLAHGSLLVEVEGKTSEFKAPHMIYVKADKYHRLTALEDDTVAFCIHALRDVDTGDILDPTMIPAGVTADNAGTTCVNWEQNIEEIHEKIHGSV